MITHQKRMIALIDELSTGEGLRPTRLAGVKLSRANRSYPRAPVLYEPSIYVVAQGKKHGHLGSMTFTYDAQHYLVMAVPLPFECETVVEPGGDPMLGVSIGIDVALVSELLMKVGHKPINKKADDLPGARSIPLGEVLAEATVRLLETLKDPNEAQILGPQIVREITYRVLCGPHGDALRALVALNGKLGQIHRALQRMHTQFAEPLDIEALADDLAMSPSAFHHHFKSVTATSPLQYLKSIRLHKARMLMVQDGITASTASIRVGYESPSQFSREFKRYFGKPPTEEVESVKHLLGIDGTDISRVPSMDGVLMV